MTLDEAIAHEKIDSEHCSILCTHETNINDCIECRAYHKQVYEWLKELKKIKSSTVPYYDGFKEGKQVGYDKAIDDFVKEISESNKGHWRPTKYEHGEVVSETMSYDIGTIRLIAEQLKADGKTEEDECINKATQLAFDDAKNIVQEVAEEYNNGWIPCSERLPEPKTKSFGNKQKRTNVLVTLRNGVVKEMTYEFATKEFWEAGDENYIEHWKEDYNGNDVEVIAWMPLPEPYKGE